MIGKQLDSDIVEPLLHSLSAVFSLHQHLTKFSGNFITFLGLWAYSKYTFMGMYIVEWQDLFQSATLDSRDFDKCGFITSQTLSLHSHVWHPSRSCLYPKGQSVSQDCFLHRLHSQISQLSSFFTKPFSQGMLHITGGHVGAGVTSAQAHNGQPANN